jgi:vacuolar-type H+-ATPase subunit E/Vma4
MSVNGLERMTQQILADARAQADAILGAAREECAKIAVESEAEADRIRKRLSQEAETQAAALIAETKSSAAARKNELLLTRQGALVDRVFAHTLEETLTMERGKYAELLGGILAAAVYEFCRTDAENLTLYGENGEEDEDDRDAAFEVMLNKKDRDTVGEDALTAARRRLSGKVPEEALKAMTLSHKTVQIQGGVVLCRGPVEYNCSFEILFAGLRRDLEHEVSEALFAFRGNGL